MDEQNTKCIPTEDFQVYSISVAHIDLYTLANSEDQPNQDFKRKISKIFFFFFTLVHLKIW
jgi:hypothetical protein